MDIIFFAAIAIFIFVKLREQLGKISDDEKEKIQEKIKIKQQQIAAIQEQVIKQIETASEEQKQKDEKILAVLDENLRKKFEEILQKAQISAEFFINGAKSAFEMVLVGFSKENLQDLEMLLSEKILQNFKNAIEERKSQQKILNTNLIAIEKAEIISASILENEALITIKFQSKQINYFTNLNGEIIDGKKDEIAELQDIWTFKKDLNSTNPNWKISATG